MSDYSRFHFLVSGDLTFKPENFKVGSRACMDTRTCLRPWTRVLMHAWTRVLQACMNTRGCAHAPTHSPSNGPERRVCARSGRRAPNRCYRYYLSVMQRAVRTPRVMLYAVQLIKAVKGFDRFDLRSVQLVITNKTQALRAAPGPQTCACARNRPCAVRSRNAVHADPAKHEAGSPRSRCRCGPRPIRPRLRRRRRKRGRG